MMTVKEILENFANDNEGYLDRYLIYHSNEAEALEMQKTHLIIRGLAI
ncbi:hypothetical protein BN134_3199 [Cronobacter dublinensis 1210]|uniref:Uncharacterized protein n=1 Tax=Cronobacter dublinensis 1210 TaxID=1208656 RepID=A0ABM9QA28_9ENTR|nr:hypothetical protein [Cronobacter dublinensis]CCJ82438.1 hypothetical protein BN134_3199 [Cronobacter dublinensis 1210]ELY4003042.1 hypothetical protein [Cronobacter dublinensis]MDI7274182.1 hypothetical protein [Cronobacter dublinensis]MDI7503089.1 hypothetical protein [Cronobacter dublinensis]MDT3607637.1 hypothetical protein [Cronobacter dublinensis]